MAAVVTKLEIIHAYRALLRQGLIAIQYSSPARYAIRDKLRNAFRQRSASDYNQTRISNTLDFLKVAGRKKGLEHKLVKNLCIVHWWQNNSKARPRSNLTPEKRALYKASYDSYDEVLRLLNDSMELDLV